nr:MAG TPA: hypothetical protein [Caudoviricetes sp.]
MIVKCPVSTRVTRCLLAITMGYSSPRNRKQPSFARYGLSDFF